MKKLLFTLLTAACFAGAASAVDVNWAGSLVNANSDGTYSVGSVGEWSNKFTVVFAFTLTADQLSNMGFTTKLVTVSGSATDNDGNVTTTNTQTFAANNTYAYVESITNDSYDHFTSRSALKLKEGENYVALVFDRYENGNVYMNYIVNGTKNSGNDFSFKWTNGELVDVDYTSITANVAGVTNGKIFVVDGALEVNDLTSLPEPTALALLALGAAGLALRRKVA